MIRKIYFKKRNLILDNNLHEIEFDENNNIIIGPKGSGKSTLFDLLAGIKENCIYDNVEKAFSEFGIDFIKYEKFNGEVVNANQLKRKKEKEKDNDFKNRNDVIAQDDEIKKNINKSEQIDKQKYNFSKEKAFASNEVKEIINEINILYSNIEKMNKIDNKNSINWTNIFKIVNNANQNKILFSLNYSNDKLKIDFLNVLKRIESIINNCSSQIIEYSHWKSIDLYVAYHDENLKKEFQNSYMKQIDNLINENQKLINMLLPEKNKIKKIIKISEIFKNSYNEVINNLKKNDFDKIGIEHFKIQSLDYFKEKAKDLVNIIFLFKKFLSKNYELEIKDNEREQEFLSYRINSPINLSDKIEEVLSIVLYSPSEKDSIYKWLIKNKISTMKEFKEEKIINKFAKILKEEVIVLANGKDYNTMSLGERSIYGIEYKFKNSKNNGIFLDQPEDNLDNKTIAEKITKLINEKAEYQNFIVTHNANIGILTNSKRFIIAGYNSSNNNNDDFIYKTINFNQDNLANLDIANYLEGGINPLEIRYNTLTKKG